jgi:hypothetical protein
MAGNRSQAMNLRPVETIGLRAILDLVGPNNPACDRCTFLPERLPNTAPASPIVPLPRDDILVADPMALYWFTRMHGQGVPDDALGLLVIVPYGETVEAGMLVQAFAVFQRERIAYPEGPVRLVTLDGELEVEQGMLIEGKDGPKAMSDGLISEVPHALASLQASLKRRGDSF